MLTAERRTGRARLQPGRTEALRTAALAAEARAQVAGTAFLPWERWLTQLLHPLYVRIRKWHSEHETRGLLLKSQTWLRVRGTITSVQYDSSLPREGLWYAYNPREGYYSGFSWRWFDSTIPMHVLAGDLVLLRYNPSNPDASVIVGCESQHSELAIPVELRG